MKKYLQVLIAVIILGFSGQIAFAQTEPANNSQNPMPVSDISLIKVVEQASNFLKSDAVQKVKDKALPILAKIDAWREGQIPKISALQEKADPESFTSSFYAIALKAFSSKSIFYGAFIFLALLVLSRVKRVFK